MCIRDSNKALFFDDSSFSGGYFSNCVAEILHVIKSNVTLPMIHDSFFWVVIDLDVMFYLD